MISNCSHLDRDVSVILSAAKDLLSRPLATEYHGVERSITE
jgi:hypothetical protein